MKLAILCQEEPTTFGPYLREVIRLRPQQVAAVFIAGRRGAGEPGRTPHGRRTSRRVFWSILGPWGFVAGLLCRLRARILGTADPASVEALARLLDVPVHHVGDPNEPKFHQVLRRVAPDVVLNQSERILRAEVLSIPRLGFINRHASLLPRFRGRLASFWSHAAEPPEYGTTVHVVDDGIDTGPIVLQREFDDIDPRWSYWRVLHALFEKAPPLIWEAVDLLAQDGFVPRPQEPVDAPHDFPTLPQAKAYVRTLRARRRGAAPRRTRPAPTVRARERQEA